MSDGHPSANGGLHHEERDYPSPPPSTTPEDLAVAIGALAVDVRDRYTVVSERLQALHDRAGDHEKASLRRQEDLQDQVTALSRKVDFSVVLSGQHSATLATIQSDVAAVVRAVTVERRESVANEARQDAEIANAKKLATKAQALALVRKGAFAAGVAIGTALVLEGRTLVAMLAKAIGVTP